MQFNDNGTMNGHDIWWKGSHRSHTISCQVILLQFNLPSQPRHFHKCMKRWRQPGGLLEGLFCVFESIYLVPREQVQTTVSHLRQNGNIQWAGKGKGTVVHVWSFPPRSGHVSTWLFIVSNYLCEQAKIVKQCGVNFFFLKN